MIGEKLPARPRLLVVRLDSIGDCVLSSVFFQGLREAFPTADITGVLRTSTAPLYQESGLFDRIIVADPDCPGAGLSPPYDLAVGPRWDIDYWNLAEWIRQSEAPLTVGFDRGAYGYGMELTDPPGIAWTKTASSDPCRHEALKNADLLAFMGIETKVVKPRLYIPADSIDRGRAIRKRLAGGRYAVLGISAAYPRRVWPTENFLAIVDALYTNWGMRCFVIGGDEASGSARWLESARPETVISIAGHTDLMTSAAVVADADLYVGMDSGPMHMAAASGVPVIEISCHPITGSEAHDNSPERFGPFLTRSRVVRPAAPQPPCTDGCDK